MAESFGDELERYCELRGMSWRGLAMRVGCSPGWLSKIKNGKGIPSPDLAARLDATLGASGALVSLAPTESAPIVEERRAAEDDVERRAALQILGLAGVGIGTPLEILRTGLHDAAPASDALDEWELTVQRHALDSPHRPFVALIGDLATDLADFRTVLARHAEQTGYQRVAGQLAALTAYALAGMGHAGAANRWWRTARRSADASGDHSLSVWMRARQAVNLDWSSSADQVIALRLLDDAERHAAGRPSGGLAEARWARAGVLAHVGHDQGALRALNELDDLYPRLPHEATTAAGGYLWGWCQDRHEFETAWLRIVLGDLAAVEHASRQPSPENSVSERWRAQALLNAAGGMIRAGEARAGVETALETYTALPDGHRSATVKTLARRVVSTLPEQARHLPAAREMRALVTSFPAVSS